MCFQQRFCCWVIPVCQTILFLKYSGQNEPFISLPRHLGQLSNEPTPPDLDTTYVDKEQGDIDKKPPAKKPKTMEKKEKSPEGRILKKKELRKMLKFQK